MPTGYTAVLEQQPDISLADFTLRCARNFGALIMLRDAPMDAPLPADVGESLDAYKKAVRKAKREVARLAKLTPTEWGLEYERERKRRARAQENAKAKALQWRVSCDRLASEIRGWTPPSPEHEGVKAFMLEQLESTANFDGRALDASYYAVPPLATWRADRTRRAADDLTYHEKALAEVVERNRARNEWVRALRESLAKVRP